MKNYTKIYLAGGLKTDWRQRVINNCQGNFIFYNPKEHGLENSGVAEYSTWDLYHVRKCDIVFGYMEKENPSGYGLSLEIGFARALNKCIVLVDEKSINDDWFKSKYDIVRSVANVNYDSLEAGISFLNSFVKEKSIIIK